MKRFTFLFAGAALALVIGLGGLERSHEAFAATKTFSMTARQWEFDPSTITVDEGDTVVLNITSEDVTHGFFISAFDVSETLTAGQTTTVQFVADQDGTFSFSCNISCGSGHSTMRGTLVVNAADEPEPEPEDEDENENVNDDTPADSTAPVLSAVTLGTVTETTAVVTWTTDEPAKGRVEFGLKAGTYISSTSEESTFRASHGLTVTNLTAGTMYFYRARSVDEAGNTGVSAEKSFTTAKATPEETPTNTNTNTSANTNTSTNSNSNTNTNTSTNTNATNANSNTSSTNSSTNTNASTTPSPVTPTIETIETPSGVFSVPELQTGTSETAASSTTSASTGDEESILQGDPITFRGTTTPLAAVSVTVRSDPQTGTTISDENGDWSYTFEDGFDYGVHTATVAVTKPDTQEVTESDPVSFEVIPVARAQTNVNVLTEDEASPEDDRSSWVGIGVAVLAGLLLLLGGLLLWYRRMKKES